MDLGTILGLSDASSLLVLAGIISAMPGASHRGRVSMKPERRGRDEKEFGPPELEDYMALWTGLNALRKNEFYGLSEREGVVTTRDVTNRVKSLCRRNGWSVNLEKKLIHLAMKRNEREAERSYPGHGLTAFGKSKITQVECEKVIKYLKKTGVVEYGAPIFEFAGHRDMLARAFAMRVGKPNDLIVKDNHRLVYEFYSLDVQQVLTEQGRYYLMKGCAEIQTDKKLGLAHVRIFQRWGASTRSGGDRPILTMDEEYEGNIFMQDDVLYTLAFKADKGQGKHEGKSEARKNMVSMVLSGFSRDSDGFHRKMTGGQIGQGIGGTVGVLSAPCVFYRVGPERLAEIQDRMREEDPKYFKLLESKSKEALPYESLKWDSEFIDLLNGVDQRFAPVMADLDVPMPLPESEEKGGAQIVLGG